MKILASEKKVNHFLQAKLLIQFNSIQYPPVDYKNFWLSILRRLEPTIARSQFLTWFQNTAILTLENETLVVGAPTNFSCAWISKKYALKILQAAEEENPQIKEVEFEVETALGDGIDPRTIDLRAVFAKPDDKKIYIMIKS